MVAGAAAELRVGMVMGTMRAEMKRMQRVQSVEAERERGETVREFTGSEENGGKDRVIMQLERCKQDFQELPAECK